MPKQTRAERDDLAGAAGVSAAEALGVEQAEDDLDADGQVDQDDTLIEAAHGADDDDEDQADELPGEDADEDVSVMLGGRPRPRGPVDPVTAAWGDWEIPPAVAGFLKMDEHRVISVRRHAILLVWPAVALLGGLLLTIALNAWAYETGHAGHLLVHFLWWSWTFGAGWAVYKWLEWRQTWFVITGFRVMLLETTNLLGRRVRMVPIDKLRDVQISQTPLGRIQRYATFTFASIGTGGPDNSLTAVDYLPDPQWLYQRICELTMPTPTGRTMRRQ